MATSYTTAPINNHTTRNTCPQYAIHGPSHAQLCLILGHITDHFALSTALKLTQKTFSRGSRLSAAPMDVTECRCTGSLISSTFISSVPRRAVPTLREISTRARLSRNFNTCRKANAPIQFSRWRKATDSRRGTPSDLSSTFHFSNKWRRWEQCPRGLDSMGNASLSDDPVPGPQILGSNFQFLLGLPTI